MNIKVGDEVAILPRLGAAADEVLGILKVRHVGPVFVEVTDGRMYATLGLLGLNTDGCIAEVTDEHRQALG
jgi:hypothetical protein